MHSGILYNSRTCFIVRLYLRAVIRSRLQDLHRLYVYLPFLSNLEMGNSCLHTEQRFAVTTAIVLFA